MCAHRCHRGRAGHETRHQPAGGQPGTWPEQPQRDMAGGLQDQDQQHQRRQLARLHTGQPGHWLLRHQRDQHQCQGGQQQAVVQLLLGEQLRRKVVQAPASRQQGRHGRAHASAQRRLCHRQHAHHVGDHQGQLGGHARVGWRGWLEWVVRPLRILRIVFGRAARPQPQAVGIGQPGQHHHRQAAQRHQQGLRQPLGQRASQRHQGEASNAGRAAPGSHALAAFALQADQQTYAQRHRQAQQHGHQLDMLQLYVLQRQGLRRQQGHLAIRAVSSARWGAAYGRSAWGLQVRRHHADEARSAWNSKNFCPV